MEDHVVQNDLLGVTAHWTAVVRAIESNREDRLFNDPWAMVLAGENDRTTGLPAESYSGVAVVLRTRFFDNFLLRVTHEQAVRQVVIVGAGLDARAYRLAWPAQTLIFELDQLQVLTHKEQILASVEAKPTCERRAIVTDLTTHSWMEALQKAGFDSQQPAAWLLEGLLFYLPTENEIRLLENITTLAAPGSWIGFDAINSDMLTSPSTRSFIEMMEKAGVPWKGTLDDPKGVLTEHGWSATLAQLGEDGLNFGRWQYPVIPLSVPAMPRFWFVTAQRQMR
jgi:methyltransferase (TIGR00027 family)